MPLEQRDAVYLIAVTSIDFNVSYEPYAGRSNCKTPSVRKTTKREHWKCAKSFQPDWNTCVLWEGDLNDRSYESGIAGDHAYPNACEKKHASHHVLRTWRAEKPSNGTLEVPVTNWTSCEEAHYNRKNPQTNLIRTKNKENAWNNTQLWSRPQGVNPYFGCVLIAHFCYTAPEPLDLRWISRVSSAIPECGGILNSACTGHTMRSPKRHLLSISAQVFTIYIWKSTPASKCYAIQAGNGSVTRRAGNYMRSSSSAGENMGMRSGGISSWKPSRKACNPNFKKKQEIELIEFTCICFRTELRRRCSDSSFT